MSSLSCYKVLLATLTYQNLRYFQYKYVITSTLSSRFFPALEKTEK